MRPPPSDAAARYQKPKRKAINNLGDESKLSVPGLMSGNVAEQREFEHFSLEGFDHQNQPDHDHGERYYRRDQQHDEWPEDGDDEQNNAGQFERDGEQNGRGSQQKALDGMEAHEAVLVIRLDKQEKDGRDESEISERPDNIFGKSANLAVGARFRLEGKATTRAESGGRGHLRCAVRTRCQLDRGRIHCGDHIKTRGVRQMGVVSLGSGSVSKYALQRLKPRLSLCTYDVAEAAPLPNEFKLTLTVQLRIDGKADE